MPLDARWRWGVATFAPGYFRADNTFSTLSTHYSAVTTKEATGSGKFAASWAERTMARAVAARSRLCNLCSCRMARHFCYALKPAARASLFLQILAGTCEAEQTFCELHFLW